jgi:hypothetical protein
LTTIWIVAESGDATALALAGQMDALGHPCTVLSPQQAVPRLVRDAGGDLIDSIRGLIRGIRDRDLESLDEASGVDGRPDVVVLTSPTLFGSAQVFTRLTEQGVLRVGVMPDYGMSGGWLDAPLHAWIVPVEAFVAPLEEAGVDPARVRIAGPAVPADYAEGQSRTELRESWGLGEEPVIFVHCDGGQWDLDRLMFQFSLLEEATQPVFYVGEDSGAADQLRRAARKHGVPADLLGAVPSLRDFHAVADLVVTAPDDVRVVHALAMDRPLLLVGHAPVRTQVDFLAGMGAVRHVPDLLQLGAELDLVAREETLATMAEAASKIGKADGTAAVAKALVEIVETRAEILATGAAGSPQRRGPFERIGTGQRGERLPGSGRAPASTEEARDELANLIMTERGAETRVSDAERAIEQWTQRLELAGEWNEAELEEEARKQLSRAHREAKVAGEALERTRMQKQKLKESVRRGSQSASASPDVAERFEGMEVERDLDTLRKRLEDELG